MEKDDLLYLNLFFNDTTLNGTRPYATVITKDAEKVRSKTFIYLKLPMLVNDIFRADGKKYYIKKFVAVTAEGYKYEIKREDRYNIVDTDLNRLIKGKKIKITGHYGK